MMSRNAAGSTPSALGQRDRLRQPLDQRQQPGVEDELHARAGARLVAERDGAARRPRRTPARSARARPAARRRARSACPARRAPWCRAPARRRSARRPRAARATSRSVAAMPTVLICAQHGAAGERRAPRRRPPRRRRRRRASSPRPRRRATASAARVARPSTPSAASGSARSRRAVPGAHLVARGGEVARHRRAHDPGAQDGDAHQ